VSDSSDQRTPGRRAQASSPLAQSDLARRLGRLPLPKEAIPRLVRFVEDEVEAALKARREASYTAEEIEAAGGDAELTGKLREQRAEREKVEAIRAARLHELPQDALAAVIEQARAGAGS